MVRQIKKEKKLEDFQFPLIGVSSELLDRLLDKKLPLELFLKHEGYETIIEGEMYVLHIQLF
jgi:hypothetical protein